MRVRPAAAVSTALVLLTGAALVPAAAAGPAPTGAAGAATSSLALLDVSVGATSARLLELALRSEAAGDAATTSFVVTPLAHGGTTYGRQALGNRSAALPVVDTRTSAPAALSALASAQSPTIEVSVQGGSSRAAATSLGGLSLLGLPVRLDGALEISSAAGADGSAGGKTLTLTSLALPSIADLLCARGLDLMGLPTGSLTTLLSRLDLDTTVTRQAEQVLRAALGPVGPQVDGATARLSSAGDDLTRAAAQRAVSYDRLAAATAALNGAVAALPTGSGSLRTRSNLVGLDLLPVVQDVLQPVVQPVLAPVHDPLAPVLAPVVTPVLEPVVDEVVAPVLQPVVDGALDAVLDPVLQPVLDPVVAPVVEQLLPPVLEVPALPAALPQPLLDALTAAQDAYTAAVRALQDADAALAAARQALAAAQTALDLLLAPYRSEVEALVRAVTDVLAATPLVSLDRLEVTTRSAVTSSAAGGQSAQVVGGQVRGLRVLGTDVLDAALGRSAIELLDLTGPVQTAVNGTLTGLTGALSQVLSDVPGLPGLVVPAPRVELLSRTTVTDVVDGFGVAGSALRALTVTWPGLALPAGAALPGAASLPAVAGLPALTGLPTTKALARTALPGDLLTQPLTLSVATLEDRARFRPAAAGTDGGSAPTAPGTPTAAPGLDSGAPAAPGSAPVAGPAGPAPGPAPAPVPGGRPLAGTPDADGPPSGTPTGSTSTLGQPRTTPVGLTSLPRTGTDQAPAALALLLVAAGLALHRRRAA